MQSVMKTINKIILAAVAGLISCSGLSAQEEHEFTFYTGGGLSTLNYKTSSGDRSNGFGGLVGVGYTYFLNERWGLTTGAEFGIYNAKAKIAELSDRYKTKDIEGDEFEFRTTASGYSDKQNAVILSIPLMLQFQTETDTRFYAAFGGKIGFPLKGKHTTEAALIKNSGYYEYENVEYTDQEFMGFGSFSNKSSSSDLDLKVAFMLSAETGIRWELSESVGLYTGIYLDYGLNNIMKSGGKENIIGYNTTKPADFELNSVFTAQKSENSNYVSIVDKVRPFALGVKLKFAF